MSPILTSVLLGLTAAGRECVWRRHYRPAKLGALVSSLLRRAGRGVHARDGAGGNGPGEHRPARPARRFSHPAGYLLVHFFEHTVTPHFHFGEETHAEQFVHTHKGYSVLIGLLIHTFFDGIAIASGFIVSNWLGWIIFIAVFLHKIPEGFTISSVMLASGRSRAFAWGTSVDAGSGDSCGSNDHGDLPPRGGFGLPLSAGVTIYVAASDLIPEVNKEPGVKMALLVFVGAACMFAAGSFFPRPLNSSQFPVLGALRKIDHTHRDMDLRDSLGRSRFSRGHLSNC